VIVDPSRKSVTHVERIRRITEQVGITYKNLFLVGNYEFDEESEQYLQSTGEAYLGKMEYDIDLKKYNLTGKSLLDLPEDSPACCSIRQIMSKAGYEI
jgi:CO dehydrogenase nickel-insertion accessory protein CooC1